MPNPGSGCVFGETEVTVGAWGERVFRFRSREERRERKRRKFSRYAGGASRLLRRRVSLRGIEPRPTAPLAALYAGSRPSIRPAHRSLTRYRTRKNDTRRNRMSASPANHRHEDATTSVVAAGSASHWPCVPQGTHGLQCHRRKPVLGAHRAAHSAAGSPTTAKRFSQTPVDPRDWALVSRHACRNLRIERTQAQTSERRRRKCTGVWRLGRLAGKSAGNGVHAAQRNSCSLLTPL